MGFTKFWQASFICGVRIRAALLSIRMPAIATSWIIIYVLIEGCASAPPRVRLYNGEALPTNEIATIRLGEGIKAFKCESGDLMTGKVGELLPGSYEITIEGWWWDRTNEVTNIIRGTLATTCFLGVYGTSLILYPLLATCLALKPDKTCDCRASIDVSAGKTYVLSIDWSGITPMLCLSETNGSITVVTVECVIRE